VSATVERGVSASTAVTAVSNALRSCDLGDAPSPDPATDPTRPAPPWPWPGPASRQQRRLPPGSPRDCDGHRDAVCADAWLTLQSRTSAATRSGDWTDLPLGGNVTFAGMADGPVRLQTRAADPCHSYADVAPRTDDLAVDTTPPAITMRTGRGRLRQRRPWRGRPTTAPAPGSGRRRGPSTGRQRNRARSTCTNWLRQSTPSLSSLPISSATPGATKTFRVRATAQSLLGNLNAGAQKGPRAAGHPHQPPIQARGRCRQSRAGQHCTEHAQLRAFLSELEAQSRRGIGPATAKRLRTFVQDLIASYG
jgi:hypothetical protein